ncbi:MAG: hypothetical protein RLZZ293_887 [Pseudomonadota bacterium]|jgi:riboflavin synthase
MFTGIIEEIGKIKQIVRSGQTLQLVIQAKIVVEQLKIGDSIAVNGVCLTVVKFTATQFSVDVMPVTFKSTALAKLINGSLVNLERAMLNNGRFDGHIVSGHIDGVGKIIQRKRLENSELFTIQIPNEIAQYCVKKGSIAIDGTSLTIVDCANDWLQVSLIPHTQEQTILGKQLVGTMVNLENDILAKYQNKANIVKHSSLVNLDFLRQHGFA